MGLQHMIFDTSATAQGMRMGVATQVLNPSDANLFADLPCIGSNYGIIRAL